MNTVTLSGRIAKEVKLRYIPGTGTPVANTTLAVNRDFTKRDGTREADFIPVEIMGKGAEYRANYVEVGRLVELTGSIRVDNYQDKDGTKKTFTKVSTRGITSLEKSRDNSNKEPYNPPTRNPSEPRFEPPGTGQYGSVDDEDIPF